MQVAIETIKILDTVTGEESLIEAGDPVALPSSPGGLTQDEVKALIREFRHTVVLDTADHNKATTPEAITAFKQLPHYDWSKDDAFYIKDVTGKKMISLKYFADGATSEATHGRFYYRAMTETQPN